MRTFAVVVPARPRLPAAQPQERTPAPAGGEADGPAVPPGMVGACPEAAARQDQPAGPHGCTGKNGTCKGRGGPDRKCAAHKER